jgi:hypothetical protein
MRKYTAEEMKKYWMARCYECGWKGLTIDCNGFGAIADSGDYDDGYCPKCNSIVEGDEDSSHEHLKWAFRFVTFWRLRRRIREDRAERIWIRGMERQIAEAEQKCRDEGLVS